MLRKGEYIKKTRNLFRSARPENLANAQEILQLSFSFYFFFIRYAPKKHTTTTKIFPEMFLTSFFTYGILPFP